ncbi:IPT/TIG domain-containing protein, partial [candidate division KSB1 bacterium]|nr:IPT/TIG domain-containing protein [candidate division KSB1 bacterium]
MKKINYIIVTLLLLIFALVLITGCGEDATPSLFDPNKASGPTPVLTKVLPLDSTLSGVGVITLEGQNFSPNKAENLVFFNQTRVEVLSATATQLTVRPPDLPGVVTIKVAVHQAELFSNTVSYILKTSVSNLYSFLPTQQPYAITSDAVGDIFISMVEADKGTGIKKITPDGVWSDWAPKGGETFWSGLKMGPANTIYAVRQVRAVFQTSAGVISSTFTSVTNTSAKLLDLDYDAATNMWVGGNSPELYRIKADKSVKAFPFVAVVRAMRVFNNYLYVAAEKESQTKIYRFPIVAEDLG